MSRNSDVRATGLSLDGADRVYIVDPATSRTRRAKLALIAAADWGVRAGIALALALPLLALGAVLRDQVSTAYLWVGGFTLWVSAFILWPIVFGLPQVRLLHVEAASRGKVRTLVNDIESLNRQRAVDQAQLARIQRMLWEATGTPGISGAAAEEAVQVAFEALEPARERARARDAELGNRFREIVEGEADGD